MSAVWTVQEAIYNAILADDVLAATLKGEKVYSLNVPQSDDVLPYILLADSAESRLPVFERRGQTGQERLSGWSSDLTKYELGAVIVPRLVAVLDHTRLTLDGYTFITGELTLLTLGLDTSSQPPRYSRAVLNYEVLSIA